MLQQKTLNQINALLEALPVSDGESEVIISSGSNVVFPEETPEEIDLREYLSIVPRDEFIFLKAVVMLGKSFYEDESWDAILADAAADTQEVSIDYMMGFAQHMNEYIITGIERATRQGVNVLQG